MSQTPALFSDEAHRAKIRQLLTNYLRLPFSSDVVPGSLMEAILAKIHDAEVLKTYDFVDVVQRGSLGWQVKSTKASTPVTWMRAKLPNKQTLIDASQRDEAARQTLGNAIIALCNSHARASMETYNLQEIGYARLVLFRDGRLMYFERSLIRLDHLTLFNPDDYVWQWSSPKNTLGKEQLPAFVGRHNQTGDKHFAWHGLGENQLHFSGESMWWPHEGDPHRMDFPSPNNAQKGRFRYFGRLVRSVTVH